jgi:hypothetical protein
MNLFVLTLYPLIPLEAVTIADKSLDLFIEPLHLGQVFKVDIYNYFGLDCIKRFRERSIDKGSDDEINPVKPTAVGPRFWKALRIRIIWFTAISPCILYT